jgi:hypothetical protein
MKAVLADAFAVYIRHNQAASTTAQMHTRQTKALTAWVSCLETRMHGVFFAKMTAECCTAPVLV